MRAPRVDDFRGQYLDSIGFGVAGAVLSAVEHAVAVARLNISLEVDVPPEDVHHAGDDGQVRARLLGLLVERPVADHPADGPHFLLVGDFVLVEPDTVVVAVPSQAQVGAKRDLEGLEVSRPVSVGCLVIPASIGPMRAVAGRFEVEVDVAAGPQPAHGPVPAEAREPQAAFPLVIFIAPQHAPQVFALFQFVRHLLRVFQRRWRQAAVGFVVGWRDVLQQAVPLLDPGQCILRQEGVFAWRRVRSVGDGRYPCRAPSPGPWYPSPAEPDHFSDPFPTQGAPLLHLQLDGFQSGAAASRGSRFEIQVQPLTRLEAGDGILPVDGLEPLFGFLGGNPETPENPPKGLAPADGVAHLVQGLERPDGRGRFGRGRG